MNQDVLQRYGVKSNSPLHGAGAISESESIENLNAFGWLRGIRERALMLELRTKSGHILALAYGWLERADFDPSLGITLQFGEQRVRISGRNLNAEIRQGVRLFEGITRQRVPWITEHGDTARMDSADRGVVVDSIELV